MNFTSIGALIALLTGSSQGLASSLVHSQGTSSTCAEACIEAKTASYDQIQNLCQGGTAVEKSSQSKCVDGGDYDVKCNLTLEIQCSPTSGASDWRIGPSKLSSKIVTAACGELGPELGDQCVLWGLATDQRTPTLFGYVVDQDTFASVIPEGIQNIVGKTLKVSTNSLSNLTDRLSEDAMLGKVIRLATLDSVIDPRTAPTGYENKGGMIAHAVCGEIDPRLGDQCVMLVRKSTGAYVVVIADQDLVQDEFSGISGLSGNWIKLDVIFKPVSTSEASAAKGLLVSKYFLTDEWTVGN